MSSIPRHTLVTPVLVLPCLHSSFVCARVLYTDLNILKIIRKGMEQRNSYFSSLTGVSSMPLCCHFLIPHL